MLSPKQERSLTPEACLFGLSALPEAANDPKWRNSTDLANLARPGGNITGVGVDVGLEIWPKRLEVLREAVAGPSRAGFLDPRTSWEGPSLKTMRVGAERLGLSILGPPLEGDLQEQEYRRVFTAMSQQHVDALVVGTDAENLIRQRLIIELARENRLPAIYSWRDPVELGGFMGFGYDLAELWGHAAEQIDKILKGAKPGDIPIYQPTKYRFVINAKTAKAIGLTIPPSLLLRADDVVE
jgi:putative ABC transport system substrate-binding protein